MRTSIIRLIAQKDMKSIWKNSKVWLGLVLLPILFGIIMPTLVVVGVRWLDPSMLNLGNLKGIADQLVGDLPLQQQLIIFFMNYLYVPLFLLIPVTNAVMIGMNGFVSEKERGTLESLLLAPIEIKELFLGKLIAAFVPSYSTAIISFLSCSLIITTLTYPLFGYIILPVTQWLIILLWTAPLFTLTAILFSVLISARSRGFQEAQQLGSIVVLPLIALIVGQSTGLVAISPLLLLLLGAVLLVINIVLLLVITKYNQRDLLFERQIH